MCNRLTAVVPLMVFATATCVFAQDDLDRRVEETVRELGVLESSETVEIRSPLNSTILFVVPEGTSVKKGDLLVELDSSRIDNEYNEQKVRLNAAQAGVLEAKARREAIKMEAESAVELAQLGLHVAELELQRFVGDGGELALRMTEADAELTVARERLNTAERMAQLTEANVGLGRSGPTESAATALAVVEAKQKLAVAEANKRWIDTHVRGHESAALQLKRREAELELVRAKNDSRLELVNADAELETAESALVAEERKFVRLQKQLDGCKVHAPKDGIVIFPVQSSNRGARSPLIEMGAEVRERQAILRLVDMSDLQVRVNVHQSRTGRVRVGQPAVIRFDALPEQSFNGKVVSVSATPEPTSWLDGNIKRYPVVVSIEDAPDILRLGMTAVVEIDASVDNRRRN